MLSLTMRGEALDGLPAVVQAVLAARVQALTERLGGGQRDALAGPARAAVRAITTGANEALTATTDRQAKQEAVRAHAFNGALAAKTNLGEAVFGRKRTAVAATERGGRAAA